MIKEIEECDKLDEEIRIQQNILSIKKRKKIRV